MAARRPPSCSCWQPSPLSAPLSVCANGAVAARRSGVVCDPVLDLWIEVVDLDIVASGIFGGEQAARSHITQDLDGFGLPVPIDRISILDGEAKNDPTTLLRNTKGCFVGVLQRNVGAACFGMEENEIANRRGKCLDDLKT